MSGGGGEFNPWPSFVDLFTSVIMVLVLLFLIMVVNVGYYAQFKYKVSYTGSISTDNVILNDNPTINKQDEEAVKTETKDTTIQTKNMQKLIQQVQVLQEQQKINQEIPIKQKVRDYMLESPGLTINKEDTNGNQNSLEKDMYFLVNFSGSEIFMDDAIIKKVKTFIVNATQKYPGHSIKIYAQDPKNQLSATVAKQISLGRTLSARNLIRKLGYEKSDVNVDLSGNGNIEDKIENEQGYVLIKIVTSKN